MNIKKYFSVFFASLSVLFLSCTRDFRQMFADRIDFIPKFKIKLLSEEKEKAILSKKVPLILNIKFNDAYNNNKSNKPASPHRYENWEVDPSVIDFRIKNIRIHGGAGKLYRKVNGSDELGAPLKKGDKIRHGDTKLWYIPNSNKSCYKHEISIDAIILTCDFDREAGEFVTCSVILDEPDYKIEVKKDTEIAYVEDKEGTPIELTILSDNPLAELQEYKIVTSCITGGKGELYIESDGVKKPICSNKFIQFGTNKLFYRPSLQSGSEEENHTIHLTIGNSRGNITQESSIDIKVQDHRVEDFKAEMTTEDKLLLPYKEAACTLTITNLDKEAKEMEYKVSSISLGGGKFFIDGGELSEGKILKIGENKLIFKPLNYIGDIFPTIVLTNSKGDSRYVTFPSQFVISHPQFSVETSIEDEHIVLNVSCDNKDVSDKFYVTNYTVSGGLKGKLKTLRGNVVEKGIPVLVGDNKFTFEVDQTSISNIHSAPQIYFNVSFPDHSRINTEGLDLSRFVLELLRPKISELDDQSKELYKPLMQDYTHPLDPVMKQLINVESTWSNSGSKIHDILVCFQHGTDVSNQAREALANIQLLQTDTKDKIKKRVLTTSMLSSWNKELSEINAAQSSEARRIKENLLESKIESLSDVFESCVNIEGLQDIPGALVSLRMDIERVKIETLRKETAEKNKETEYENFQQATRSAIVTEREARQNGDDRLERSIDNQVERLQSDISSLESSRYEIEEKIRNHTGSIENLEEKVRELDRVNGDIRSKLEKHQIQQRLKEIAVSIDDASQIKFELPKNDSVVDYQNARISKLKKERSKLEEKIKTKII